MSEFKVYQPLYYKKFQCTGSSCRSNCCGHNWQIRIDKSTYGKYRSLDDETGRELIDNIKIYSQEPFIANMVMDSEGNCHFLDEKGLCSIQKKLGYDYLSRTCRIHPRSISFIAGEFETYLHLSCEEAVKVVLFEKNIMKFEEAAPELDGDGNFLPNRLLAMEKYTTAENAVEIFWKLRSTSLVIMQSRQYSVRIRMLILCLFIERINAMFEAGRDAEVALFADGFSESMYTKDYNSLALQMSDGVTLKADIVLDILTEIETTKDAQFNTVFARALEGLDISPVSKKLPADFHENYAKHYDLYFSDKEYIFENYIVNHVMMDGFPFDYKNETGGVKKNFADLLVKYNLIEFLLVGACRYSMKFDKRSIIDCVSAFSRKYDHSLKGYLKTDF